MRIINEKIVTRLKLLLINSIKFEESREKIINDVYSGLFKIDDEKSINNKNVLIC